MHSATAIMEEVTGGPLGKAHDAAHGRLVGAMVWILKALAAKGAQLHNSPQYYYTPALLEYIAWPDDTDNPELKELLNDNQYYKSASAALESVF